ncbi:MAG: hypothetical protein RL266_1228 [Bacteroidota bacterium]|jgi:hypothetical protein
MKKSLLFVLGFGGFTFGSFGQTQPPNIDFENWETLSGPISNQYEEPVGYGTSNECTALINQFAVTKSSDAHSGSYSVRMETFQAFGNIKANGVITTAEMICLAAGGGQQGGISYTEEFPDSLIGWYKYAPANNDSAYSQIMFLSNNDQDTTCFTRLDLHAAAEWTRFSVAICPGVTGSAEKLSLFFSSSWGDGSLGQAEVGSILYIDDIQFLTTVGIDEAPSENTWNVYPNPTEGVLNVQVLKGAQAEIQILDLAGKLVKVATVNDAGQTVDLSELKDGIYIYRLKSIDDVTLRTGRLLVNP